MARISEDDITAVYYTANFAPKHFLEATQNTLLKAIGTMPLVSVSQEPMDFGTNIVVPKLRSHVNIYRQALIGAKAAKTEYIALCEDDVLYSPQHFEYRPKSGKFAYNLACWSMYTWTNPPMFTYKGGGRVNLHSLICERDLFIAAMSERFSRWPDEAKINTNVWAEPGKYEQYLDVTIREKELYFSNPPNIFFSHETSLQYLGLGQRKKLGQMRAIEVPHWGLASDIIKIYKK